MTTFATLVDVHGFKLDPAWMYRDSDGSARHDDEFIMSEGLHAVHGNLNPLSRAAEAALEAHRLQGQCAL